jgi:hypothetical protein
MLAANQTCRIERQVVRARSKSSTLSIAEHSPSLHKGNGDKAGSGGKSLRRGRIIVGPTYPTGEIWVQGKSGDEIRGLDLTFLGRKSAPGSANVEIVDYH